MRSQSARGHDLLAFTTSAALGALGLAVATPSSAAAAIVASLVSNLALNYGAAKIDPMLGRFNSADWSATNFDLDRVAEHALLTLLYETLIDNEIDTAEAEQSVKAAGDSWDLRIFRDGFPNEDELIAYLREPGPMPIAQAERLAHQILIRHQSLRAAYSEALSKSFARTFEILLRSDERAYRAAVVYLQRLALDDAGRIKTELGGLKSRTADLAAAFDLLARPQPALERYEGRQANDETPSITDLQFKRRAIRYRPREPVIDSLTEFLQSSHPFRILKITGAAGMGKSRLALELCDWASRDGWLAGFIAGGDWPQPWTPNRDTLAVLDYAGSKSIAGKAAFRWLESIFFQMTRPANYGRPPRVRIVLLDRTEQGALWSDWNNSDAKADLHELTLSIPLAPERAEFDAIVGDEFLRRKGRQPFPAERRAIDALAQRLRGQYRPLFASLTAAAVADPPPGLVPSWSPELLIENMLNAQQRKWKEAGITDADLDLLFEATLTQGSSGTDWERRVEERTPAALAVLGSLSEPETLLGPIVPDLLGEFFILMRLRGEATTETRARPANIRKANEIVATSWKNEAAALYVGRLLEDYLGWTLQHHGLDPSAELMRQALAEMEAGRYSFGLGYCCFAAAWKRPFVRDWSAWLGQLMSATEPAAVAANQEILEAVSVGLYNATVTESDLAQCRALADRIEQLHNDYGYEPAVREQLSVALRNATVTESDSAQCRALADRIEQLHNDYGHEPAVREQLARALLNATVTESDPAQRRALADRIEQLHNDYGHEPAVREQLAGALRNATVTESDPAQRRALADRIEQLHNDYGHEPAVREQLAGALYNATVGESDSAQCRALADRIEQLHNDYGHEPAVREQLARALLNATVGESDPAQLDALRARLERLAADFPGEPRGPAVGL